MWIPTYWIAMKHIEDMFLDKFKDVVCILQLSIAIDGVNLYSPIKKLFYLSSGGD